VWEDRAAAAGRQLRRVCVAETHSAEQVLAAEPYPGAPSTRSPAGTPPGHFIHITSHRRDPHAPAHGALAEPGSGCRFDELYCSDDKGFTRCEAIGIDVLIDDCAGQPPARAADAGIHAPATILHPLEPRAVARPRTSSAPPTGRGSRTGCRSCFA